MFTGNDLIRLKKIYSENSGFYKGSINHTSKSRKRRRELERNMIKKVSEELGIPIAEVKKDYGQSIKDLINKQSI